MPPRLHEVLSLNPTAHPEAARYEVLGVLGRGAMGQVLLGRDIKLRRQVAIKLLAPESTDPEATRRFHREAQVLAALDHPNILHILDYSGADCPWPFLVAERLNGIELEQACRRGLLNETQLLAVAHEVASALDAAHAMGLVHRDVKPSNIFLQNNGRVVLIDFGFAVGTRAERTRVTFAGRPTSLMGTPDFISPEQVSSAATLQPASDLFSLGSTLYYAATRVLPFRGEGLLEILQAVTSTVQIPLIDLVDCSVELSALVDGLLEKSPAQRFGPARAVVERCAELLQQQQGGSIAKIVAELLPEVAPPPPELSLEQLRAALAIADDAFDEKTVVARAREAETRVRKLLSDKIDKTKERTLVATQPALRRPARKTKRGISLWLAIGAAVTLGLLAALVLLRPPNEPPVPLVITTPSVAVPPTAVSPTPPPSALQPSVVRTAPPSTAAPVTVRIAVKPWGEVKIDGVYRGRTPSLRTVDLLPGHHIIEVSNPETGLRQAGFDILPQAGEQIVKFDLSQR